MLSTLFARPLQHVAKVSEAAVRVVALLVFALVVAIPALVILIAAVFRDDSQDYANVFLGHIAEIFKTITPVQSTIGAAQLQTPDGDVSD